MFMLFDSHAHLNFEEFKDDWQDVIADCQKNDIWFINVGAQFKTSQRGIEIAEKYEQGVWASVALHPIHVEGSKFHPEKFIYQDYADLVKSSKKVIAIGETGIDFFHLASNFSQQKEVFVSHINLAKEFNLPLVVHGRNSRDGKISAYQKILEILKKENFKNGVIHCFGGTLKDAMAFLQYGFYLGFTGIITFDKTGNLAQIIENLPLDSILIETDSPYLAPLPYRGQRNQPQYVKYVAEKISLIKRIDYQQVAQQTKANAKKLFNLLVD